MKVSSAALLVAAALGVAARHNHHNAHRHVKRGTDYVMAKKPGYTPPNGYGNPPAPAPTPTTLSQQPQATAASAAPSGSAAPAGSGSCSEIGPSQYTPFCSGNTKRATVGQIAYKGNVGAPGNYGCNFMLVKSEATSLFDYSIVFSNPTNEVYSCSCWNKIGSDGGINPGFQPSVVFSFELRPGCKQGVVAEKNSQGGCGCASSNGPSKTSFGQYAGTWVESDFCNESNNGWSGADASCLVAAKFGLPIPGMNVCAGNVCSTIFPGGGGKNAYVGGTEDLDGVGINHPPGPLHLNVTVGA